MENDTKALMSVDSCVAGTPPPQGLRVSSRWLWWLCTKTRAKRNHIPLAGVGLRECLRALTCSSCPALGGGRSPEMEASRRPQPSSSVSCHAEEKQAPVATPLEGRIGHLLGDPSGGARKTWGDPSRRYVEGAAARLG